MLTSYARIMFLKKQVQIIGNTDLMIFNKAMKMDSQFISWPLVIILKP